MQNSNKIQTANKNNPKWGKDFENLP